MGEDDLLEQMCEDNQILRPINDLPLLLRSEYIYGWFDKSYNDILWALPTMKKGDYFLLQGKYWFTLAECISMFVMHE